MTEILAPFPSGYSPVLSFLSKAKGVITGKEFWKNNGSLTKDQSYIIEIKKLIRNFCIRNEFFFNRQLKWELLKWELLIYETNC